MAAMAQRPPPGSATAQRGDLGRSCGCQGLGAGDTCIHPMPNMGIAHPLRSMIPVSNRVRMSLGSVLDRDADECASVAHPEAPLRSSCRHEVAPVPIVARVSALGLVQVGKAIPASEAPEVVFFPAAEQNGTASAGEDFDGAARTGWASWRVVQSGRCLVPFKPGKTTEIRQRISLNNRANRVTRG